jgi:Uma2 family endonuclease
MSAMPDRRKFSLEEYFVLEQDATYRSEYVNGEIFAMTGASPRHVTISTNTLAAFHAQLRGKPCRVYTSDLRLRVNKDIFYPDVTVVCGEPNIAKGDVLLNPTLLAEVLSPSTADYDKGVKMNKYITLESLKDYLLIDQAMPSIMHYTRQGAGWFLMTYTSLSDVLDLPNVGCTLALTDVYERVDFDEQDDTSHA